jgi:hypothetical protein
MTFDKTEYLTIDEAARYLKEKRGEDVRWTHVFRLALDGHLPLVVRIPVSTPVWGPSNKDGIKPTIEGVWGLVMEGDQGKHARRWIERLYRGLADLPPVPRLPSESDGAWVERDGDRHKLDPYCYLPQALADNVVALDQYQKTNPALPHGCILGARAEAVEALLAKDWASSEPIKTEWKDVTITFTSEFQVQLLVGDQSHVVTYADLGFRNERHDKPNLAWEKFRALAEANPHRLDLAPKKDQKSWERETGDKERVTIQQRVKEIRANLQNALKRMGYTIPAKTDPLPYDKEHDCYTPTFSIKLTHSYGSTTPR